MIRHTTLHNINVDDDLRELCVAETMRSLLRLYTPRIAIAAALTLRGTSRVIRPVDAGLFHRLCTHCGVEEAFFTQWRIALSAGFFLHLDLPILPGISFDINALSDVSCRRRFRFDHRGIKEMVVAMNMPDVIVTPCHGDRVLSIEALCLVLDRLTFPRKWDDLAQQYDRHTSALSRIFNYMMHIIMKPAKSHILLSPTITAVRVEEYAKAFWRRGVPTNLRICSVIDVKKVKNCRPTTNQRAQYSGHTKYHCFKYQTLQTPDGIISHCFRCCDGRRGDGYIIRRSNLIPFLTAHQVLNRRHYVVFGDSAYPNNNVMITMFRGRNLPEYAQRFNKALAKVRVSVEWGYSQVCKNFAHNDWSKQLKIELMAVEAMWHVSVFFTNCLTCYWGRNQISDFFHCSLPTLNEYLDGFTIVDDDE